ncbi:hypothetical protein MRB53_040307 [Persea americana]|nr:hypothetical protein MRB53_040307 [Persea americana]
MYLIGRAAPIPIGATVQPSSALLLGRNSAPSCSLMLPHGCCCSSSSGFVVPRLSPLTVQYCVLYPSDESSPTSSIHSSRHVCRARSPQTPPMSSALPHPVPSPVFPQMVAAITAAPSHNLMWSVPRPRRRPSLNPSTRPVAPPPSRHVRWDCVVEASWSSAVFDLWTVPAQTLFAMICPLRSYIRPLSRTRPPVCPGILTPPSARILIPRLPATPHSLPTRHTAPSLHVPHLSSWPTSPIWVLIVHNSPKPSAVRHHPSRLLPSTANHRRGCTPNVAVPDLLARLLASCACGGCWILLLPLASLQPSLPLLSLLRPSSFPLCRLLPDCVRPLATHHRILPGSSPSTSYTPPTTHQLLFHLSLGRYSDQLLADFRISTGHRELDPPLRS